MLIIIAYFSYEIIVIFQTVNKENITQNYFENLYSTKIYIKAR